MYVDLFRAFHALTKARLGDLSALALLGDQVRETLKFGLKEKSKYYRLLYAYYDAACIHSALAKRALEDRETAAGRAPAARPTGPRSRAWISSTRRAAPANSGG